MDPVQALQDAADLAREHDRHDLAERLLEAREDARELEEETRALRRRVSELEGEGGPGTDAEREGGDPGMDEEGDDRGTSWRGRQ